MTDDEDPTITCASDQTQTADPGVCEAAVTVVGPSFGDNCPGSSIENDYNNTSDASDTYPVGTDYDNMDSNGCSWKHGDVYAGYHGDG